MWPGVTPKLTVGRACDVSAASATVSAWLDVAPDDWLAMVKWTVACGSSTEPLLPSTTSTEIRVVGEMADTVDEPPCGVGRAGGLIRTVRRAR